MSKIKQKNSNQILLKDVLNIYQQENFSRANELLKKAKITSDESGIAKQLKVEINNQLAIENIKNLNFKNALNIVINNFNIQPKQEFPLALEKSKVIAGISELYLGNFGSAENYLKDTKDDTLLKPFYFYYIIAGLYGNKYTDIKSLSEFDKLFKNYFDDLKPNKVLYLQGLYYLMKDNLKTFMSKIKKISQESHLQKLNLELLLNKISSKTKESSVSIGIKPLYKLLSGLELSLSEKDYLSIYPVVKNRIEQNINTNKDINLKQKLENLCNSGEILDNESILLTEANDFFSNEFKYIIYNQIVSIINIENENKEALPKTIDLIDKYKNIFFSFPDSIYPYIRHFKISKSNNVNKFISHFSLFLSLNKQKLTKGQIEVIGLLLYDIFAYRFSFDEFKKNISKLNDFINLKENILGIRLLDLLGLTFVSQSIPDKNHLSLFLNPDISDYNNFITTQLESFFNDKKIEADEFTNKKALKFVHLPYAEKLFNLLTTDFVPHRRAKVILDFYLYFSQYINFLKTDYSAKFNDDILDKYSNSYLKQIEYFRENNENSVYYKDYLNLQNHELFDILLIGLKNVNFKIIKEEYIKAIRIGNEKIIQKFISNFINFASLKMISEKYERDFEKNNLALITLMYFGYIEDNKNIETDKIRELTEMFFPLKNDDVFLRLPIRFFNEIMVKITHDKYRRLIYEIFKIFSPHLFTYPFFIEKYNSVIKFLTSFAKLKDANIDFYYEDVLFLQCLDYLEKVYTERKLISVAKTHNLTIDVFNINKNKIELAIREKEKAKIKKQKNENP
ncbi:MAG: hypothetical protein Q8880_08915, partial [Bacteroidota bacterium]|nr:hypothetical protein [Bacteroidota bacterium]